MLLLGEFVASKKMIYLKYHALGTSHFGHSTSKTFFDDICPLFTSNFMSYFIHEIIPLKNLRFFKVIISWKLAKILVLTIHRLLLSYLFMPIKKLSSINYRSSSLLQEERDIRRSFLLTVHIHHMVLFSPFYCQAPYF